MNWIGNANSVTIRPVLAKHKMLLCTLILLAHQESYVVVTKKAPYYFQNENGLSLLSIGRQKRQFTQKTFVGIFTIMAS